MGVGDGLPAMAITSLALDRGTGSLTSERENISLPRTQVCEDLPSLSLFPTPSLGQRLL